MRNELAHAWPLHGIEPATTSMIIDQTTCRYIPRSCIHICVFKKIYIYVYLRRKIYIYNLHGFANDDSQVVKRVHALGREAEVHRVRYLYLQTTHVYTSIDDDGDDAYDSAGRLILSTAGSCGWVESSSRGVSDSLSAMASAPACMGLLIGVCIAAGCEFYAPQSGKLQQMCGGERRHRLNYTAKVILF